VAIVGTEVMLKEMETGEQRETEIGNVIPSILRGNKL
jgi:hypothetical protein